MLFTGYSLNFNLQSIKINEIHLSYAEQGFIVVITERKNDTDVRFNEMT